MAVEKWQRSPHGTYSRGEYEIRKVYHDRLPDSESHTSPTWEVYHIPTLAGAKKGIIGDRLTLARAKILAEEDERARSTVRNKLGKPRGKSNALPIIPERHFIGQVTLENLEHLKEINLTQCDFGIQTHDDGRVWICLNGIAFLRFKPKITDQELVKMFPLKGKDNG